MKKFPILCALFLVYSLSGCAIRNSIKGSVKTKGYVIKRVKTPDMTAPSASADDGSGWKLIDFSQPYYAGASLKGVRMNVTVYFFREFENFTCRIYRRENGKPGGDAASLPKKALGVGFHKFHVKTRKIGKIRLGCRETDSMPLLLSEFEAEQKRQMEKTEP